jgi:hypothetical protein
MQCLAALGLLLAASVCAAAADGPPVDVALVLLTDVSRSIDDSEFLLEKHGYTTAFTPQVIEAIRGGPAGRIAVAYVEFAGSDQTRTVVDWTVISDEKSAKAFAAMLESAPRSFYGRTAIGSGIDQAVRLLTNPALQGARPVIDVAGDGVSNAGRFVTDARDAAVDAGITINGLTIINDHPVSYTYAHTQPPGGLSQYYRDNVIGGPGAFVVEVHDFQSFGEAMARKLLSEIAALPSHRG